MGLVIFLAMAFREGQTRSRLRLHWGTACAPNQGWSAWVPDHRRYRVHHRLRGVLSPCRLRAAVS